ncbi:MAG TPA: hypothetical protein VN775_11910 [Opitutaceae bacterium]|nr:hypothetical protein [Opitutaceae bacterium]
MARRNPRVPARSFDGAIRRYFPCSFNLYVPGKYQIKARGR